MHISFANDAHFVLRIIRERDGVPVMCEDNDAACAEFGGDVDFVIGGGVTENHAGFPVGGAIGEPILLAGCPLLCMGGSRKGKPQ